MEAPLIDLKTPGGVDYQIREWITGRQADDIKRPILSSVRVTPSPEGHVEMGALDTAKVEESERAKISVWVVTLGGSKENVLDRVLDLRASERDAIAAAIEEQSKKG